MPIFVEIATKSQAGQGVVKEALIVGLSSNVTFTAPSSLRFFRVTCTMSDVYAEKGIVEIFNAISTPKASKSIQMIEVRTVDTAFKWPFTTNVPFLHSSAFYFQDCLVEFGRKPVLPAKVVIQGRKSGIVADFTGVDDLGVMEFRNMGNFDITTNPQVNAKMMFSNCDIGTGLKCGKYDVNYVLPKKIGGNYIEIRTDSSIGKHGEELYVGGALQFAT